MTGVKLLKRHGYGRASTGLLRRRLSCAALIRQVRMAVLNCRTGQFHPIGGPLKLDMLDPEPAILAQQLLEGEIFTDRAAVYRAIAEVAGESFFRTKGTGRMMVVVSTD